MFALYLFLRGHNQPGGGFVAGLALRSRSSCSTWSPARSGSRTASRSGRCAGSASACCSPRHGPGAWLFGHPFLTTHTAHVELPLLGELHVPSAMFFDLGVFALVVGATLLMLIALAHQSIRGHRAGSRRRRCRARLMEVVVALAIGVLAGSGVWLLLRPRTFQVLIGLALLSYAVNLFIFAWAAWRSARAPIIAAGVPRGSCCTTPTRCRRRWC